jgi:L-lactate dehydrogenase complex protein LldF
MAGHAGERLIWKLWAWIARSPTRFALAGRLARLGSRLPFLARLVPPLAAWRSSRELPEIAPRPFRALWKERRR